MEAQGIIRKISIGDLKEGLTYVVGQPQNRGRMTIVQILHDTYYLAEHNINKYDVYVEEEGTDEVRIWKSFMNGQITVEYDIRISHEVV